MNLRAFGRSVRVWFKFRDMDEANAIRRPDEHIMGDPLTAGGLKRELGKISKLNGSECEWHAENLLFKKDFKKKSEVYGSKPECRLVKTVFAIRTLFLSTQMNKRIKTNTTRSSC